MAFMKSDFAEWREMGITQAWIKELEEQSSLAITEIINRRDADVPRDQYLKGMIMAFSEMLAWEPEFIQEETNGNTEAGRLEDSRSA